MRLSRLSVILVMLWMVPPAIAAEQKPLKGIALVIGESRYANLPTLQNPANDEKAMAELFGKLGFDVTTAADADHKKLQRTLDRFVEDAADADVAVIYYSGHGIEAGGENYLMPTDADISTPAAAGDSAVPVGALLNELAKTVPVSIVLLDACRSNAFPVGTTITLPGSGTVAVDPTGLAAVRGPTPVLPASDPKSLGMVIGFAAAPGMAALDGPANGNSPYAAALLKHLGAGGYSFGDVMTMVSEEVYLKTDARQLPWTNSSLRRVLNFGAEADAPTDADESAIADGRRKLLLSIASTPDDLRKQVEVAAQQAAVPMDALYGLLETLGQQVPADPVTLGKLLRTQTQQLKQIMAEHTALTSTDPEITRISGLAQRALDEGALGLSVKFWEEAKRRYAAIAQNLDQTEADLKGRRLEGGALLAKTADAYALSGDYQNAADNYAQASAQVAKWDPKLAATYWANAQNSQGIALQDIGRRQGDVDLLAQAADAFNAVLTVWTFEAEPDAWMVAKGNLAAVLNELGMLDAGLDRVKQSVQAYRDILAVMRQADDPFSWAMTEGNFGNALALLGERSGDAAPLNEAVDAFEKSLGALDRSKTADAWALVQSNYGTVLSDLARAGDETMYQRAVDAYVAALEIDGHDTAPQAWARDQNNLASLYENAGNRTHDGGKLSDAVAIYRAVLKVTSKQDERVSYWQVQGNLARALNELGNLQSGTDALEQSVAAAKEALSLVPRTQLRDWATLESLLGNSTAEIGIRTHDRRLIQAGRDELVAARKAFKAAGDNYDGFYTRRLATIDTALKAMK